MVPNTHSDKALMSAPKSCCGATTYCSKLLLSWLLSILLGFSAWSALWNTTRHSRSPSQRILFSWDSMEVSYLTGEQLVLFAAGSVWCHKYTGRGRSPSLLQAALSAVMEYLPSLCSPCFLVQPLSFLQGIRTESFSSRKSEIWQSHVIAFWQVWFPPILGSVTGGKTMQV